MTQLVQHAEVSVETALPEPTEPTAKRLNIAEARENLTDLVNEVAFQGQRLVVMRRGKELAALVPMADLGTLLSVEVPKVTVIQDARCFSLTLAVPPKNEGETTENP